MSGATILRKRVRRDFVQVPNATIRDGGLSFKAVGVLVHMLSLPDGATISADKLAQAHKEGRSAILAALQELRDGGYYRTRKERNAQGQLFTVCEVADERGKLLEETAPESPPEAPEFDYPTSVQPTSDNPTPKEEDLLEIPTDTPCSPPATTSDTGTEAPPAEREPDPFDAQFWPAYPRRVKKPAARRALTKALKTASIDDILAGLERWCRYWTERGQPEFVPYPATWLNGEQWNDDPPSVAPTKRAEHERQLVSAADRFLAAHTAQQPKELTDGIA